MFKDLHNLVEQCILRKEKAWEKFIQRFSGLLYYSACERLNRSGFAFGTQDIEDIVQAVFVDIWEKGRLEEVRDRRRITAWLSTIAQRRALNYMRIKKERLLHNDELYRINNLQERNYTDTSGYTEELFVGKLNETLERFEDREKIVVKLNVIQGKTHKEIARFMNIPINTVSTIIARKKKILKERLKNLKEIRDF